MAIAAKPHASQPNGRMLACGACADWASPGFRHYSESFAIVLRVAAAVLQIAHELDSERLAHTRQQAQWQVGSRASDAHKRHSARCDLHVCAREPPQRATLRLPLFAFVHGSRSGPN